MCACASSLEQIRVLLVEEVRLLPEHAVAHAVEVFARPLAHHQVELKPSALLAPVQQAPPHVVPVIRVDVERARPPQFPELARPRHQGRNAPRGRRRRSSSSSRRGPRRGLRVAIPPPPRGSGPFLSSSLLPPSPSPLLPPRFTAPDPLSVRGERERGRGVPLTALGRGDSTRPPPR